MIQETKGFTDRGKKQLSDYTVLIGAANASGSAALGAKPLAGNRGGRRACSTPSVAGSSTNQRPRATQAAAADTRHSATRALPSGSAPAPAHDAAVEGERMAGGNPPAA